jgi:hypothetical protein
LSYAHELQDQNPVPAAQLIKKLQSQSGTALLAAARDNLSATAGGHSGHKTDSAVPSLIRRLIRSFHFNLTLFLQFV